MSQQAISALPWLPILPGLAGLLQRGQYVVLNECVALQMRLLRRRTGG